MIKLIKKLELGEEFLYDSYMEIKVLSYNIHKAKSFLFKKSTLKPLKDKLKKTQADIIFLQEVMGRNDHCELQATSQFEFLADDIWNYHAYSKNAVYDSGDHGNVILSKYPIIESFKADISTNPLEKRGLLFAKLELANENYVYCICVHLNLLNKGRIKQYDMINNFINEHVPKNARLILAGDFNDWNKKAHGHIQSSYDFLEPHKVRFGQYKKTFPSILPILNLDRVYVKFFSEIDVINIDKDFKTLSDHLPLYVKLKI